TRLRRRASRAAPTCASSSDLLVAGGLELVGVLVAPGDVDAGSRLDRRAVVRPDDREPVARVGVDMDAAEGADEDDVRDGRGDACSVQLDPLRPDRDAPAVPLDDVRGADETCYELG